MPMDEKELIQRIKQSDSQAFKRLYESYYTELYRFTWRRTRDREGSLDIIQDVFVKLWQNRQRLDETQNIKSYLYRSAVNQTIDLLRKKSVRQQSPLEFIVEPVTEEEVEQVNQRQSLEKAMNGLSEKQKQVFMMRHVEGLKNKEIADILGVTVKAVEKRMTTALKLLRSYLSQIMLFITYSG